VLTSLCLAGLAAACGGSPAVRVTPQTVSDLPSPVPTVAVVASPTQPAATPTGGPALNPTAEGAAVSTPQVREFATATPRPGTLEIKVGDYFFDPAVVTITVGTTIIWHAVGDLQHTIVPKDPINAFPAGYTAGTGSPDVDWTATRAGTIFYHCDYHPGAMDAILVVVDE
jgi:plastocyanin